MNRIELLNTMIETRHWRDTEEFDIFLEAHEKYEEMYHISKCLNDEEMILLIRSCSEKDGMMDFTYLLEDAILIHLDNSPDSRELFIVESLKNTDGYFELLLIMSGLLHFHPETCDILMEELKNLSATALDKMRAVLREEDYDFPECVNKFIGK